MLINRSTALICIFSCFITSATASFKCSSDRSSCNAIIDYVSPQSTSFSDIITLFNITNFRLFLGVNNLPSSTLLNEGVIVYQTLKIPIPCICNNGTGKTNKVPAYTVDVGDSLYRIGDMFSGLVTYKEIQDANNISDSNLIEVGQKLWIPLPCSCDDVDGRRVVHYGHLVGAASSVEEIAQQYSTSQEVLLRLNDLTSPGDLKAGAVLDVPLKACTTMVSNKSTDYPLLVPDGTYVFTANDCVVCNCDAAANNWMLHCVPSQNKSCPSMQCQGSDNWYLGNTTSFSSCNRSTCSYAGFTNQTILTSIVPLESTCAGRNKATGVIAGGVAAGAALLFAIPVIAFAWWRCKKPRGSSYDLPDNLEVHPGQLKRFSLWELQFATDTFSEKNILGIGGFGKVYKGRLSDGTLVAVKRLKDERTPGGELQFQTEVEMISIALHRNLLRLRGFCMTPTERLLVYPYMANGSLASCLRERPLGVPPLDWPTRMRIALGSARGLSYLHDHCDPKIIHRDVKAANILLDDEFEAVVGDFGLTKIMGYKETHITTAVCGTLGHIAPEYLATGKCNEKTDVFGYGIMLLELISGQRAIDLARLAYDDDIMLLDWVKGLLEEKKLEKLVDPEPLRKYVDTEVEKLIQVALLCTQGLQNRRPKMSDVVKMLEGVGLADKWNEWKNFEKELLEQPKSSERIVEKTENLDAVELSGPR